MRWLLMLLPFVASAQFYPELEWQKFYGSGGNDLPHQLIVTPDSQLVLAGAWVDTVNCHRGWVFSLDKDGKVLWDKKLGSDGCTEVNCLQMSQDGASMMFCGTSGEDLLHHESQTGVFAQDYWVGKIELDGKLVWNKTFGGAKPDQAFAIAPSNFGGSVIIGSSWSRDHDVTTSSDALNNLWLLILNKYGQASRNVSLGGSKNDWGTDIIATKDGGYMALGYTTSEDLDDSRARNNGDAWLIKFSMAGEVEWQRVLKEPYEDILLNLVENRYGIFAAVGSSFSSDGAKQFWFIKFDKSGRLLADKKWGGKGFEELRSLKPTQDGGYIACGFSHYYSLDNKYIKGQRDLWVIRFDSDGDIIWQQTYGGPNMEEGVDIVEYRKNEYYVLGKKVNTFETNKAKRGDDFWVLKIKEKACNGMDVSFQTNTIKNKANVNVPIQFVNQSRDGDRFEWDFGDGTTSKEKSPQKAYTEAGTYVIRLTAFKNEGCSKTFLFPAPLQIK